MHPAFPVVFTNSWGEEPKYPMKVHELLGDFPTLIATASQRDQLPSDRRSTKRSAGAGGCESNGDFQQLRTEAAA
jgi:hypothetical protein